MAIRTRFRFKTIWLPGLVLLGLWVLLFRFAGETNATTLAFLLLSLLSLIGILTLNSSPILTLDGDRLTARFLLHRETRSVSDIVSIRPNQYEAPWFSMGKYFMTGISFKQEEQWDITSVSYANLGEVLSVLYEKIPERFDPVMPESPSTTEIKQGIYGEYVFTSLFFYLSVLGISFFTFSLFRQTIPWFLALPMIILVYFGSGNNLYWFEISEGQLIVRNDYFRWFSRSFALDDIYEINQVRLYSGRESSRLMGLKITTRRFETFIYAADSLDTVEWDSIMECLKTDGVNAIS